MIMGDFFLSSAWGLLSPVYALFVVNRITGGDIARAAKIAGFAALCYWLVKSFLQFPISRYLDRNHGEKDDFLFMVLGTFFSGLIPFGFMISSQPWHVFGLEILHAAAMSMFIPSWYAIFTRHIDKGQEAFEWGMDSTFLGIGVGITGAAGGMITALLGFNVIFILVGTLNFISACLYLLTYKNILSKENFPHRLPPSMPI
jgi:MFS family permease